MKASDLFVKILEEHWVETIYWVPGEENLDFLDSLSRSNIELIITRNEQTAVFMAATFGRLTWKVGVAISTLGPGATNMLTGVAYAQLWGMPILVITGQKPVKHSKQGAFQIIDVVSMMKPITKYTTTIFSPARIPHILNNAIATAENERPWAVHIELPEDIAWEEINSDITIKDIVKSRRPWIDKKMLNTFIWEIEKAKSPIILVWAWANRKRITKYLTKFISDYNIPYFTSQMGKWVVDWKNDQYLWTAALTAWDYIHSALEKSDLIISIWYDPIEKPTKILSWTDTKVIHVNFYPVDSDLVYHPYLEVIGDIWNTMWLLSEKNINSSNWDFSEIYKINKENKKIIKQNLSLEDHTDIMMPRKLCNDVREVLKKDDILTLDNWLYKVWIARNYRTYEPNTLLLDNALATMWAWLSSAMEAKRLNPDKKVVCVTWDWWLVMNLWDIETAVRLKLDIVVVILNNRNYWMIKWKQKNSWFGDFWLDFWNPDFVKLADSFWAKWYKVKKKQDFKNILEKSVKSKWVILIDVDFEYPEEIK